LSTACGILREQRALERRLGTVSADASDYQVLSKRLDGATARLSKAAKAYWRVTSDPFQAKLCVPRTIAQTY